MHIIRFRHCKYVSPLDEIAFALRFALTIDIWQFIRAIHIYRKLIIVLWSRWGGPFFTESLICKFGIIGTYCICDGRICSIYRVVWFAVNRLESIKSISGFYIEELEVGFIDFWIINFNMVIFDIMRNLYAISVHMFVNGIF